MTNAQKFLVTRQSFTIRLVRRYLMGEDPRFPAPFLVSARGHVRAVSSLVSIDRLRVFERSVERLIPGLRPTPQTNEAIFPEMVPATEPGVEPPSPPPAKQARPFTVEEVRRALERQRRQPPEQAPARREAPPFAAQPHAPPPMPQEPEAGPKAKPRARVEEITPSQREAIRVFEPLESLAPKTSEPPEPLEHPAPEEREPSLSSEKRTQSIAPFASRDQRASPSPQPPLSHSQAPSSQPPPPSGQAPSMLEAAPLKEVPAPVPSPSETAPQAPEEGPPAEEKQRQGPITKQEERPLSEIRQVQRAMSDMPPPTSTEPGRAFPPEALQFPQPQEDTSSPVPLRRSETFAEQPPEASEEKAPSVTQRTPLEEEPSPSLSTLKKEKVPPVEPLRRVISHTDVMGSREPRLTPEEQAPQPGPAAGEQRARLPSDSGPAPLAPRDIGTDYEAQLARWAAEQAVQHEEETRESATVMGSREPRPTPEATSRSVPEDQPPRAPGGEEEGIPPTGSQQGAAPLPLERHPVRGFRLRPGSQKERELVSSAEPALREALSPSGEGSAPPARLPIQSIPLQQALFGSPQAPPSPARQAPESTLTAPLRRQAAPPSRAETEERETPSGPEAPSRPPSPTEPPGVTREPREEIDLEALADKIYKKIWNRLRVERERLGGIRYR